MKRVIWFGLGIAVTVVAAGYVARTHERFKAVAALSSPAGIGDQIGHLAVAVRDVAEEFRRSMLEHEEALTQSLLGDPAKTETSLGDKALGDSAHTTRRERRNTTSTRMDSYNPTGEDLNDLDRYL